MPSCMVPTIHSCGFAVVGSVLEHETIARLLAELARVERGSRLSRGEQVYAIRNLLEVVPAIRELANSEVLRRLAEPILGSNAFPVQGIFFDKPAEVNL